MDESNIKELINEINYLKRILEDNKISYQDYQSFISERDNFCNVDKNQDTNIALKEITKADVLLFFSFFKGRNDVYAKRFNSKSGKSGYSWVCNNLWKDGCPKKTNPSYKCRECNNQSYKQLTGNDLIDHLLGVKEDESDVIGIYPLLKDNTCNFLVFDFDEHDSNSLKIASKASWTVEISVLREICKHDNIPYLLERSRSGNGGHLWIFFQESIQAKVARSFGDALLNRGMSYFNLKNFNYFDRMIPAQDELPTTKDGKTGLGNLVALPLQGRALIKGNSAFVDDDFNAYPNQFEVLKNSRKLSASFVNEYISKAAVVNEESISEENRVSLKPWDKRRKVYKEDVSGEVEITLSNRIYINTINIKERSQNALRMLSCFHNPVYYKNKAKGYSNFGVERFVYAGYDEGNYICLPRGLYDTIIENLNEENICYKINDLRQAGKKIDVSFNGELYNEQLDAIKSIDRYNTGIIGATTSFGKTVVGSYLISKNKVNTLILVHTKQILAQWVDELKKFLTFNVELPTYATKSGRIKTRNEIVGQLYSGRDTLTGIVDVALFSSFGKGEDINPILKEYGMVIMDECHHGAAETVVEVIDEVKAKYVYGLTATTKRDDGKEKLVYMNFGPVRFHYSTKERLAKQNIPHYVYPRFTRVAPGIDEDINKINSKIIDSKERNGLIINDILDCVKNKRTPLVLTKQKRHAQLLFDSLENKVDKIFLLHGGISDKDKELQRKELASVKGAESLAIIAIDKYVGEGFNYPRLDTMMLAMPIKWEGKVEQCVGRLHRDYEGKKDVIIYDYIDYHIAQLDRMYQSRLKTYKKIGYELFDNSKANIDDINDNRILDANTYLDTFNRDILNSKNEVIISSIGLSRNRIYSFINLIKEKQHEGVKFKVITLSSEMYEEKYKNIIEKSIDELKNAGIYVVQNKKIFKRYAVIDSNIVYYGTINLLSNVNEDDGIIRIQDSTLAQDMLL